MSHPLYKKKVAAEYKTLYPGGNVGDSAIKERNRIAAVLLRDEPVEVREALKREAAEELRIAKEKHEEARSGLPSEVPEDIEVCVASSLFSLPTKSIAAAEPERISGTSSNPSSTAYGCTPRHLLQY